MAFLGELLTKNENENHHGFSTRRLMDKFEIDHYRKRTVASSLSEETGTYDHA